MVDPLRIISLNQIGDEAAPLLEKVDHQSQPRFSLKRLYCKRNQRSRTLELGSEDEKLRGLGRDVNKQENYGVLGKMLRSTLYSLQYCLAIRQFNRENFEKAEQMHRRVLTSREDLLGTDHPSTLRSVPYVGYCLGKQFKFEEAGEMYRRALKGREIVLGDTHPETLITMFALVLNLGLLSKSEEAEEMSLRYLRRRVDMPRKDNLKNKLQVLNDLEALASLLMKRREYEEAEQVCRHELKGREKVYGKGHYRKLCCIQNLARLLQERGKDEEAEELNGRVLRGMKKLFGEYDPYVPNGVDAPVCGGVEQGEGEEVEMNREAEGVLEIDHLDTRSSMGDLAKDPIY